MVWSKKAFKITFVVLAFFAILGFAFSKNNSVHFIANIFAWTCLFICSPIPWRVSLGLLTALSVFPFFISAAYLESRSIGSNILEHVLVISPVYQLSRFFGDPWISPILYDDTPFHFQLEFGHSLIPVFFTSIIFFLCVVKSLAKN